jgi:hypothetical protein
LFDLTSQHSKALATIANDVNKALGAVVSRVDTAYTVAVWTDRAITVIEALTAAGGGARLVFKAAIKHGFARNVAVRMAIKYGIKQLAIQAVAYVAAGYALPPLIAAAGLNQDFVFAGLMVVQGIGVLHAVRSAKVAHGTSEPKSIPKSQADVPNTTRRPTSDGSGESSKSSSKSSLSVDSQLKPIDPSRFFRIPVLWNEVVEFRGLKVYRRNDLIDLDLVDSTGRTNLQRMKKRLAPIGRDGESMELHHMLQLADGPVAEVLQSFHIDKRKAIHINPPTIPSGIEEGPWTNWRRAYWRNRAMEFIRGTK